VWKKQLSDGWDAVRRSLAAPPKTLGAALADLRDPSPEVRWRATTDVRRHGGPEAVEALITAMDDPATQVRAGAALSLGILEAPEALDPLLHHFLNDEAASVRAICGSFLTRFDDPRIANAFVVALRDPDWKVVTAGCGGIQVRGAREAIPELLPLLDHPHYGVRESACSALLSLGNRDPRLIPTLQALARDPERVESEKVGAEFDRLFAREFPDEEPPALRTVQVMLDEARRLPQTDGPTGEQ